MYLIKTPGFVKEFFPQLIWDSPQPNPTIYLTFDDGPHPDITPEVLDLLDRYHAKGTFFCVGENIDKYPETFKILQDRRHGIGSHTYNHLNGWATDNDDYFKNVNRAASLTGTTLFRPPYGRIKPSQVSHLQHKYQIVMWTVLSGDFDKTLTGTQCFENVRKNTGSGSIVVFHDSVKAADRVLHALPKVLDYFTEQNYAFASLRHSMNYAAQADVPKYG